MSSKGASSFQLLYRRSPNTLPKISIPAISILARQRQVAKFRLNKMFRSDVQHYGSVAPRDFVHFWRDKERWIRSAQVVSIKGSAIILHHNDYTKKSDIIRVRKIPPPADVIIDEYIDDQAPSHKPSSQNQIKNPEFVPVGP